jgi:hypothetical protein
VPVLQVSPDKTHFICEGRPFFYLADTVWSAFTSATEEEWKEYLEYRRLQGFNALQINVLYQWDASIPYLRFPFQRDERGEYSSFQIDEAYFDFAEKLLELATQKGFIPALVLLWCNFVPDTWASQRGIPMVMPFETMERYVEYAVRRFEKFSPIFIISGDTNFGSQETVRYYLRALEITKSIAPQALTTFHLQPQADLPEEILHSPYLDFYTYQSGHVKAEQHFPYVLGEKFSALTPQRPVVNAEPCYEGHPYGFTKDGRFRVFDVRKAIWQSLLSGAQAGVTYGAHGIWSWHRKGAEFKGVEFSGEPFEWRTALTFDGAWEASFARFVFERFLLFGMRPAKRLLVGAPQEICLTVAEDGRKFALYTPFAQTVTLQLDVRQYGRYLGIDLERKRFFEPLIRFEEGRAYIEMPPFYGDCLFIGEK